MNGKKVIVTGGCGFIGSHLVRRLLEDGGVSDVVVFDSMQYGHARDAHFDDPRVTVIEHTLGGDDPQKIAKYFEGASTVFHLAAQKYNQSSSNAHAVYSENVLGAQEIFELAGTHGVSKVVFSSSLYAHGGTQSDHMSEDDLPTPHTHYGVSKLTGEHMLNVYSKLFNFSGTSLRFFFVYGPRQYPGSGYKSIIIKNFERLKNGLQPTVCGDGKQVLDYIYIDDVIDAVIKASDPEVTESVIHIGSGTGTSIYDLSSAMLSVAGSNLDLEYIEPDWTAGTVRATSIERAKKALLWEPKTSLVEGLTETYNWVKGYG